LLSLFSACSVPKKDELPTLNEAELAVQAKNPELFQIPAPSLSNNIIGEPDVQGIGVYLPPSYFTENREYPVLYFLPGFGDSYATFMLTIKGNIKSFIDGKAANEMILVGINGKNKLGGSFYANSSVTGNWEDFVTKDVIAYVDSNFRTVKSAEGRGLTGHSMGGSGVLNIAMHTSGIFGSVYAISPGAFDNEGFVQSPVSLKQIADLEDEYANLSNEEAKAAYESYISTMGDNFTFAYASAFAGDSSLKAPYIKTPQIDEAEAFAQDANWELMESGFGNIPAKLDEYKQNLLALKAFGFEYGKSDSYSWIPKGVDYLAAELKAKNIPHTFNVHEGGHGISSKRFQEVVLPFFAEQFATRG
jgi:enterochelin esterase-like enzyme